MSSVCVLTPLGRPRLTTMLYPQRPKRTTFLLDTACPFRWVKLASAHDSRAQWQFWRTMRQRKKGYAISCLKPMLRRILNLQISVCHCKTLRLTRLETALWQRNKLISHIGPVDIYAA